MIKQRIQVVMVLMCLVAFCHCSRHLSKGLRAIYFSLVLEVLIHAQLALFFLSLWLRWASVEESTWWIKAVPDDEQKAERA